MPKQPGRHRPARPRSTDASLWYGRAERHLGTQPRHCSASSSPRSWRLPEPIGHGHLAPPQRRRDIALQRVWPRSPNGPCIVWAADHIAPPASSTRSSRAASIAPEPLSLDCGGARQPRPPKLLEDIQHGPARRGRRQGRRSSALAMPNAHGQVTAMRSAKSTVTSSRPASAANWQRREPHVQNRLGGLPGLHARRFCHEASAPVAPKRSICRPKTWPSRWQRFFQTGSVCLVPDRHVLADRQRSMRWWSRPSAIAAPIVVLNCPG